VGVIDPLVDADTVTLGVLAPVPVIEGVAEAEGVMEGVIDGDTSGADGEGLGVGVTQYTTGTDAGEGAGYCTFVPVAPVVRLHVRV
jgi:hypothetical protein